MKICADVTLEQWIPNFSLSGTANPAWTRVRGAGIELCNSLEWTDWTKNPVQVVLCDSCGEDGCASGGYVHVSYLDGLVLWTTPQIDPSDEWAVRTLASHLPEASVLSAANGSALADTWALGPGRPMRTDELVPMLQARLRGCDTLDTRDAIDRVRRWVDRLAASATTPVAGKLRSPDAIGARVETLYFDGPAEEDWPALAIRGSADFLLIDRDHAFVPAEA